MLIINKFKMIIDLEVVCFFYFWFIFWYVGWFGLWGIYFVRIVWGINGGNYLRIYLF